MNRATLGGLPGAGEAKSRRRNESRLEWRGTFVFPAEHESAVVELEESRRPVVFDGLMDGERSKIEVRVTFVMPEAGMAYFEGAGEPD